MWASPCCRCRCCERTSAMRTLRSRRAAHPKCVNKCAQQLLLPLRKSLSQSLWPHRRCRTPKRSSMESQHLSQSPRRTPCLLQQGDRPSRHKPSHESNFVLLRSYALCPNPRAFQSIRGRFTLPLCFACGSGQVPLCFNFDPSFCYFSTLVSRYTLSCLLVFAPLVCSFWIVFVRFCLNTTRT